MARGLLSSTAITSMLFSLGDYQVMGGRDFVAKTIRLDNIGRFEFDWIVRPGANRISVQVKQAVNSLPRPSLVILRNKSLGIARTETIAPMGTGYVRIAPASITSTAAGIVRCELRNNLKAQLALYPAYWRNLDMGEGGLPWHCRVVSAHQERARSPGF